MFEFFAALGFLGWIIFGAMFLILTALVENESWGWTTILVILSVLAIEYFVPMSSIWSLLTNDPMLFVWYSCAYVVMGIIWSFVKWFFFALRKLDNDLNNAKQYASLRTAVKPGRDPGKLETENIPKAAEHKNQIIGWMAFWPWSAFWTLLNDPIRRMYENIASLLAGIYDKLAQRIYKSHIQ